MYRSVFVLLAVIATCAYGNIIRPRVPVLDGRIVGGEDTTINKVPYQVSLRLFNSHICGGSIVNERLIMTAAHCIYTFLSNSYYTIQYGSTVLGTTNNVIGVQNIKVHEGYDASTVNNDVALVFLSSDITLGDDAQPIKLASDAPASGTPAVVSGWGTLTEGGSSATILQKVDVEIVDISVCQKQYDGVNFITDKMLCAGVVGGGKDACQGDSGGPLAANGELVGIVSWGKGCARPEFAGVYSNVASLRSWIDSNMG